MPALGVSSPASRPSSVDLPEPDAPTMATASPGHDREVDILENRERRAVAGERHDLGDAARLHDRRDQLSD